MHWGVGTGELAIIAIALPLAGILLLLRHRAWRWAGVALLSAMVATCLSPADPLSTLLLGSLLFVFFVGGARFGRLSVRPAT